MKELNRLRGAIGDIRRYRAHQTGCEIDQTDFCTCGLREVVDELDAAWKQWYQAFEKVYELIGMDKPKDGWEMLCGHANEVPNVCPCGPTCGCKYYTCFTINPARHTQSSLRVERTEIPPATAAIIKHNLELGKRLHRLYRYRHGLFDMQETRHGEWVKLNDVLDTLASVKPAE